MTPIAIVDSLFDLLAQRFKHRDPYLRVLSHAIVLELGWPAVTIVWHRTDQIMITVNAGIACPPYPRQKFVGAYDLSDPESFDKIVAAATNLVGECHE